MSIKRAIKLIYKYAMGPEGPKCQVCGDRYEYADPKDPYCYKCFDAAKSKKKESGDFKDEAAYDEYTSMSYRIDNRKRITEREFEEFHVGEYVVHVRAGKSAYSNPEDVNYDILGKYSSVEVYIFLPKYQLRVSPSDVPEFKNKSWTKCFAGGSVGSYVPKNELQKLLIDLA